MANLNAGSRAQAGVHIGEMIAGYLSVRLDGAALKTAIAAYVATIEEFPEWAIRAACRNCANRDNPFPVSAGELRAECERVIKPFWEEAEALGQILSAQLYHQPSADEQERVKAAFADLQAELRKSNAMGELNGRRTARHQTDVSAAE